MFTSLIVLLADMAFELVAASNGLEPAGDWLLIELAIASELLAELLAAADGCVPAVAK